MRRASRQFSVLAMVGLSVLAVACGSGRREDPLLRLSAEESLAEGKRLFAAEKYGAAHPYFIHAFEVEPNSATGREALLLAADSFYFDGGETNFIQAEAKYRDFQNRFPTSERAAYVQFQIGAALAERMERPDRDQKTTRQAIAAFEETLRLYPTSEYAARARTELARVRDNLAEHEFQVGRFYLRFRLPGAAAARLEGLLAGYPQYGARDKALYHLGLAYRELGRADDAQATFSKLAAEYPASELVAKIPKPKTSGA